MTYFVRPNVVSQVLSLGVINVFIKETTLY